MKNIILITKREFLTQVKKKSFVILTILAPLLMIGFGALVAFMFKANESQYTFNVVDKSALFKSELKSTKDITYTFVPTSSEKALTTALSDIEGTDGLLIIPEFKNNDFKSLETSTQLLTNKKIGMDTRVSINNDLTEILKRVKVKNLGLSEDQILKLNEGFKISTQNILESDKPDDDFAFGVKSAFSMILMYATFMFIIIYGVRVMRSVLEEKNNRVVEIIISSIKPFDLMMGKILGVTLVALTQFIIWITMFALAAIFFNTGFGAVQNLTAGQEEIMNNFDFKQIAGQVSQTLLSMNMILIVIVFILFFLFGYIFYSSMYAAIGSAVDNETETQQFTLFAMMPLMLGMYGSFTIMNNPDGPLGVWLSIIPFTSPVAMVARIPFGVPIWQIALSLSLLIASALFMIFVAGKIYRVGILMYGNKATLKEIWKWIRE